MEMNMAEYREVEQNQQKIKERARQDIEKNEEKSIYFYRFMY